MRHLRKLATSVACGVMLFGGVAANATDWYPLPVTSSFNGNSRQVGYVPLAKASKPWQLCISFPHMKDPFFLAANYGMVEEAKRLGVSAQFLDAGGYTELKNQISQIENCVASGAKAVIMVGIAADGMNNLLTELKKKNIPVVDAYNGVNSKDTGTRVLDSPRDLALRTGQYFAKRFPKGGKPVKVAWLPGPAGAGFVEAFNAGFHEAIKDSSVQVVETKYGDVGKEIQARLVEDLLQTHNDLDYLVGNALMVEAAVPILRARNLQNKVKLVSVYMSPGVYQGVKSKSIEATGGGQVVLAARMMVDSAVRLLENKVEHRNVYTIGRVYDQDDIKTLDVTTVLAPVGFKPIFKFTK